MNKFNKGVLTPFKINVDERVNGKWFVVDQTEDGDVMEIKVRYLQSTTVWEELRRRFPDKVRDIEGKVQKRKEEALISICIDYLIVALRVNDVEYSVENGDVSKEDLREILTNEEYSHVSEQIGQYIVDKSNFLNKVKEEEEDTLKNSSSGTSDTEE